MTADMIWPAVVAVFMLVMILVFVVILLKGLLGSKQGSDHGRVDGSQEFTRITITAPDGKVLETLMAETDSVSYDPEGSFEATTKEGKNVTYLTQGFLVKMEDSSRS